MLEYPLKNWKIMSKVNLDLYWEILEGLETAEHFEILPGRGLEFRDYLKEDVINFLNTGLIVEIIVNHRDEKGRGKYRITKSKDFDKLDFGAIEIP